MGHMLHVVCVSILALALALMFSVLCGSLLAFLWVYVCKWIATQPTYRALGVDVA